MSLRGFVSITMLILSTIRAQWISSDELTLPLLNVYRSAVGYYNDTITFLGGAKGWSPYSPGPNKVIEFNISDYSFHTLSDGIITGNVYGFSDYFTQIDSILYMIRPSLTYIQTYDLSTKSFTSNYISIPDGMDSHPCLASTDDELYVIGGSNSEHLVKILSLSSSEWTDGPSMKYERAYWIACVVSSDNKNLYAIGGYDS